MTLKLGVLSDTHGREKLTAHALDWLLGKQPDVLVHAGDIGSVTVCEQLQSTGLPIHLVFGNNDYGLVEVAERFGIQNEPYHFDIDSFRFRLHHYPETRLWKGEVLDVVIFGHTHQFLAEKQEGVLFLNPGEVCAREKNLSECAVLELEGKEARVVYGHRFVDSDQWYESEFRFVPTA